MSYLVCSANFSYPDMQKIPFEVIPLKQWFLRHKRDFPWRGEPTPYEVWISEVMLQQTQATVVIDYFHRWMDRFPHLHALAEARLEEVLKMWEGLGYYSRARRLHAAAHYFVMHHQGQIPNQRTELEKVAGLGPYTIGAILSFAFHQRTAAVDGNVLRVLARYFGIAEDSSTSKVRQHIAQLAERLLPEEEPWLITEGLIELGALVCTRVPQCLQCPLKNGCIAHQTGQELELPIKKQAAKVTELNRQVMVIHAEDEVLVRKGTAGRVMADLYEFPYAEIRSDELILYMDTQFPFPRIFEKHLRPQTHSFTRYKARLIPSLWKALEKRPVESYDWMPWKKIRQLPFSAGHRRILTSLIEEHAHFTH